MLQNSDSLLSRYGWKILKEFIEGMPCFDIIQQRLNRNLCPGENRYPSPDFLRTGDQRIFSSQIPLSRSQIHDPDWGIKGCQDLRC